MSGSGPKGKNRGPTKVEEGLAVFRVELGERIRWLLDQFSTRVEAGEIADISPEHLPSYIAGRTKPRFEAMARLAAAKNVSLDWLASGEGPQTTGGDEPEGLIAIAVQGDAEARYDAGADSEMLFPQAWLRAAAPDVPASKLRVVIQRGNANEPVIRDGDMLLVDTAANRIAEDALYVFVREGRYQARFVETFIDGRVALKSRNPEYELQTLSPAEAARLQVLGRVRWRGGVV